MTALGQILDKAVSFWKNEIGFNGKWLCILFEMQLSGLYRCLFLFLLAQGFLLEAYGAGLKQDTSRVQELIERSEKHFRTLPDSAFFYADLAIVTAREIGNRKFEAKSLVLKSHAFSSIGQPGKALPLLEEADEIYRSLNLDHRSAMLQADLGWVHQMMGKFGKGLRSLHRGMNYFYSIQDTGMLSLAYNRLGIAYDKLHHYEKALEYHQLSLSLNTATSFKRGISANWNNISSVYQWMGEYDSSLVYAEKALEMKLELGDKIGQGRSLMNIGVLHTNWGNYELGEEYLLQSLTIAKEMNSAQDEVDGYGNLCYNYLERGEPEKAIGYGSIALEKIESEGIPRSILFVHQRLGQSFAATGQYKKAYEHLKSHLIISDSLLPGSLVLKVVESEAELEAEKQQAEIELLKSKDALHQLELEVQENQKYWIMALLGLMAISALVLYSRYRIKQKTNKELQALDEVKSRFFANLSHEFRTPLTLIIGPLEKLIEEGSSKEQQQEHRRILRNARHLLSLNEQLLDLARIESGKLKVNPVLGDVVAFMEPVAESFRFLAEQKQIDFSVETRGKGGEKGFDSDKLEKVVNNLISNAIKYTPVGGKIRLLVDAGESLRIEVEDSGDGIASADREKIFDRYFRLKQHLTANVAGAGIGLSLTRELVELMGGSITVESQPGEGSLFSVVLPFLSTEQVPADRPGFEQGFDNQAEGSEKQMPLLLIVDDNAEIRSFVREQFEGVYQILESKNGKLGFETALEAMPDIVITDLMMPVMDGIELCEALKSDILTSHIPVVMLTALATVESRIEGFEKGADDYLNKPFNSRELKVRVKNLIEQRRLLQKRISGESPDQEAEPLNGLPSAEEVFYAKVKELIQKHMENPDLSVEFLGSELNMSRTQLFRKLKAISGQNPSQLIRFIRLRHAAEFLANGTCNVSEAMYASGYDNPSYFSKIFRVEFGCTPSQYREKAINS